MGVMPQTESGENWLNPNDTAPMSFPLMYTGLPLMPFATLVRNALPSIFARMMSCFGPHMFLEIPTISTGIGSDSVPCRTVHAQAFIPGLISFSCMISGLPILGRGGGASADTRGRTVAAKSTIAAKNLFMELRCSRKCSSLIVIVLCDTLTPRDDARDGG